MSLLVDPDNPNHAFDPVTREHYFKRSDQTFDQFLADLADPPAEAPPAPGAVTPLQARRALNQAGLRQAVEDWIAAQPQDAQDAWNYATQIRRDDPIVAAAADALSLSAQQLDDLFALAAAL